MVEVVTEEFGTGATSMSIVDTEEGACWPSLMLAVFWFDNVEDYGHSVFIIVPYEALVRICRIRSHNTVPLVAALGRLMIRNNDPRAGC